MNYLLLTRDPLNIAEISNKVTAESCGAISLFIGTTRDNFEGKKVLSLEYEAYEPMALKQMELICEELRRQWPDIVHIAIYHRLGLVGIREASVVIAVSSPHRKTSLDAVEIAIDELKKRVPIWKKEIYEDDGSTWKENKESGVSRDCKSNPFNENMCEIEDPHPVSNQLIQIAAGEDEIKRRIQCFVEKKRDEIDFCNIMDFTDVKPRLQDNTLEGNTLIRDEGYIIQNENESMTCARVNSTVVKQEYSKCHLKVRKVENNIGPQIRPNYLNTLDKLMNPSEIGNFKESKQHTFNEDGSIKRRYPTIFHRLENIEEHINLPQSKIKNIFRRLKLIEDKIIYLESISPEYRHFLIEKAQVNDSNNPFETFNDVNPMSGSSLHERKIYSAGDIETIIQSIEGQEQVNDNSNVTDNK